MKNENSKLSQEQLQKIIDGLSDAAKARFNSLSDADKQKFLKKAEKIAAKLDARTQGKQQDIKKRAKKSGDRKGGKSSLHSGDMDIKGKLLATKDAYVISLNYLLNSCDTADADNDINEEAYSNMQSMLNRGGSIYSETSSVRHRMVSRRAIRRGRNVGYARNKASPLTKSQISKSLVKRDVKRNAAKKSKEAAKASKKSADAVKSMAKSTKKTIKRLIKAIKAMANPMMLVGGLVIIILAALLSSIAAVIGGASGAAENETSGAYEAKVSEKVESYRKLVEEYCEKYEIEDYVELCLAMIQQESSGNPPDVMQTEQSYYNTHPPIDTAEESIDHGTHELADCLKAAKCKGPDDLAGIKLAIQGYNFGNGYIAWAIKNYKGYTPESAKVFSAKMKAQLGVSGYGDVDYVPHVLRYYVEVADATVSNEDAKNILKELKENNEADSKAWKVIEKGATLIGKTKYSMDKRQDDGRDNPEYLDCSSFTAWAFHKSGFSGIPYGSTTATFKDSKRFEDVTADKLKVGDIGLKSKTGATGGANHVGIYCGKLKNGTKVWLHCTSSSSTSLTGNTEGPMFGAYTNFTYFRHFKKFD